MDRDPPAVYGSGLAVVTVIGSAGGDPDRLIDSVRVASTRPVRVVVVDTGRPDPPVPVRDGVEVLRIGEDVGRAAAVNRAVAALDPGIGWVAVASPGLQWRAGALDVLLAAADRRPRAAALGPLVRDGAGTVLPTAGPLPSPADVLRGRLAPGPAVDGPVGRLSAACVLLRRVAWDSVGGFDPRYLGVLDDVDLADRLGRAGWLCVHVPAAEVVLTRACDPGVEPPARGVQRYLADREPGWRRAVLRARTAIGARR